jgi:hypothetical protein
VNPTLQRELVALPSKQFVADLGCLPMARSVRKKMLIQNGERSILWQLHGLPMLRQGVMLGVTSWDTEDDFVVGVYTFTSADWVAGKASRKRPEAKRDTKLMERFVRGGGSRDAYFFWLAPRPLPTVDQYQVERLKKHGVEHPEGDMTFYGMVLALIGPDEFQTVVGFFSEATVNKSAGGLFRTMLLDRVEALAAARTALYTRRAQRDSSVVQSELPLG